MKKASEGRRGLLLQAGAALAGSLLVFLALESVFCLPRARPIPTDGFPLPARNLAGSRAPELADRLEVEYPAVSRRRGIEGVVLLEVSVDREGKVGDVSVVRALDRELDRAAVAAARRARFSPALKDGAPVAAKVRLPVRFELEK